MVKCHLMGMGKWRTMNYIRGHGHFEVNNCSGERSQDLRSSGLYVSLYLFVSLYLCLALSIWIFLSICLSLFTYLSVSLYLCLSLSGTLKEYLPTYLFHIFLPRFIYITGKNEQNNHEYAVLNTTYHHC